MQRFGSWGTVLESLSFDPRWRAPQPILDRSIPPGCWIKIPSLPEWRVATLTRSRRKPLSGKNTVDLFSRKSSQILREFPNPQQSHSAWDGCLGHSSDQRGICRASFISCQEIAIAITKHARNERGSAASNMARIDIACTVQREMRIDCVLNLQAAKLVLTF